MSEKKHHTNLSRSRGDSFEQWINNHFNKLGWHSRRTGGTIVHFPDVVATNNQQNTICAVEAKSTSYEYYDIDVEQILRCFRVLEMFGVYKNRYAILAWKFMTKRHRLEKTRESVFQLEETTTVFPFKSPLLKNKKIIRRNYYEYRELRHYFYIANDLMELLLHPSIEYSRIRCDYYGHLTLYPKNPVHQKLSPSLPQGTFNKNEILLPSCQLRKEQTQHLLLGNL